MFKGLFGQRPTTKGDVIMAVAGAIAAVWRGYDVVRQYKIEQEIKELNS